MRLEGFLLSLGSKAKLITHSWRLLWHYYPPASCSLQSSWHAESDFR